jgi:hypothetical protein
MITLDDLRSRAEYRVAALETLVELQRYQIELLYCQLEKYASDINTILAIDSELEKDGGERLNLKDCRAFIFPHAD